MLITRCGESITLGSFLLLSAENGNTGTMDFFLYGPYRLSGYLQANTYLVHQPTWMPDSFVSNRVPPHSQSHITFCFVYGCAEQIPTRRSSKLGAQSSKAMSFLRFNAAARRGLKIASFLVSHPSQTDFVPVPFFRQFFSNCIGNSTCHIFIILLDNAQHSVGSDVTDTCTKQWEILFVPSAEAIW